jgi:hypothetical protein
MTEPTTLSPDELSDLDVRMTDAARDGDSETVQTLLAAGANVHAGGDYALRVAACIGHTETMGVLLAAGADVHAQNDLALWWAVSVDRTEAVKVLLVAGADDDGALSWTAWNGHMETLQVLARHIFAPDAWRGKKRTEIEDHANALYDKIKAESPEPDRLRQAGSILLDTALTCWEQVRPAPPKLTLSALPAQPRPL